MSAEFGLLAFIVGWLINDSDWPPIGKACAAISAGLLALICHHLGPGL